MFCLDCLIVIIQRMMICWLMMMTSPIRPFLLLSPLLFSFRLPVAWFMVIIYDLLNGSFLWHLPLFLHLMSSFAIKNSLLCTSPLLTFFSPLPTVHPPDSILFPPKHPYNSCWGPGSTQDSLTDAKYYTSTDFFEFPFFFFFRSLCSLSFSL